MAEDSIADDLLRNGYERWKLLEGEKAAIGDDLKELFAELKGHGFTPKALRESFRRVRNIADADQQEHDAIVDLYVSSLTGARPAPARVENIEEFPAEADEVTAQKARLAALRADPAMSVVSAEKTKSQSQPLNQAEDKANSDIAQPISNEAPMAVDGDSVEVAPAPLSESVDILPGGEPVETLDGADQPPAAYIPDPGKSAEAQASAAPVSIYAAPGVITWETCPPAPVARSPYSNLFGTVGQDIAVIEDDLEAARAAPIVKIGGLIIDGWARYVKARSMFTEVIEDGEIKRLPLEYPVVQYDGTDALLDCIRWNVEGRMMTPEQKFRVAQALARLEPKRKADIFKAMDMGMELVA